MPVVPPEGRDACLLRQSKIQRPRYPPSTTTTPVFGPDETRGVCAGRTSSDRRSGHAVGPSGLLCHAFKAEVFVWKGAVAAGDAATTISEVRRSDCCVSLIVSPPSGRNLATVFGLVTLRFPECVGTRLCAWLPIPDAINEGFSKEGNTGRLPPPFARTTSAGLFGEFTTDRRLDTAADWLRAPGCSVGELLAVTPCLPSAATQPLAKTEHLQNPSATLCEPTPPPGAPA